MNYIDLFSGIGGFALGAYWAGVRFEKHYFSEIDKYCIELYSKRFPSAIQLGDITNIKPEDLPESDWIITGGFPCQDISIAGKGEGIKGERSGLWFAMFDVIRILRPRFAIIENVGAITHRGLDTVLGCLAEIGYDAEWQNIRASDMGAPHRRERIWIVAYPESSRENGIRQSRRKDIQTTSEPLGEIVSYPHRSGSGTQGYGVNGNRTEKDKGRQGKPFDWVSRQDQDVSDTTVNPKGRNESRIRRRPCGESEILRGDTNKEISNTECKGFDERYEPEKRQIARRIGEQQENWAVEPDVGRLAHGVSRRVDRLKALGNSIVPQIAELLFRQLKDLI